MLQFFSVRASALVRTLVFVLAIASSAEATAAQNVAAPRKPASTAQISSNAIPAALPPQEFSQAQAAAQKILATAEFQRKPPTLWDIVKEKIGEALVRLFAGIDRVTNASPWMGRALEWLLFIAAAVGLLVWGLRTIQRQRLRVALANAPLRDEERNRQTEDWRRQAEIEAGKGAWRKAIHAVYWAAIADLESRRAWRHNPARTPREYVRLLKPGSVEQRELRGLTVTLEKSWYGNRETREEEYRLARDSFDKLTSGAEPRAGNTSRTGFAGGSA